MTKGPKTAFVCQECGTQSPKWLGRGGDSGARDSFVQDRAQEGAAAAAAAARRATPPGPGGRRRLASAARPPPSPPPCSRPGQVRGAGSQLRLTAKGRNVPTFLVGPVTKDGSLAGPKALEHVVDTVLYFEGERHHSHRVVRAVKNRFGALSELGVFEMTSSGLRPVPNPSKMFLAERPINAPGSAVLCSVGGSRPIPVEVH